MEWNCVELLLSIQNTKMTVRSCVSTCGRDRDFNEAQLSIVFLNGTWEYFFLYKAFTVLYAITV
jgi:hypothetical protein